jgi:hypothetical protein
MLDLISQPPMCLSCEKAGAKLPAAAREAQEDESDSMAQGILIAALVAVAAFVIFVPSRDSAAFSSKLRLAAIACIVIGPALAKVSLARRKRKSRSKR